MIAMTLGEVATVVGGRADPSDSAIRVTGPLAVDSRAVAPGGLFAALRGEHADGHDHAAAALAAGAAAVLCSRPVAGPRVQVEDVMAAMGRLAAHVARALPDLTTIGITGSQGKTGVKDLVAQLLEGRAETVATEGSFNNELGLPITVTRATPSTRYLVAEMGARGRGHIAYLADIARPSVGVVLNVGTAHIGEFGGRPEIAAAKGELVEALPAEGFAILNADDALVAAMAARTRARVVTFGRAAAADVRFGEVTLDALGRPAFALRVGSESAAVSLRLTGAHQAANAAAATAVATCVGVPFADVAAALGALEPRSRWRMEVRESPAGVLVVNDAYNANPESTRAALDTLAAIARSRPGGRAVAVLGDMRELGDRSGADHRDIGAAVAGLGVAHLVTVGPESQETATAAVAAGMAPDQVEWCEDAAAAGRAASRVARRGDVVLVKASRAVGLETVAAALAGEEESSG